MAIHLATLGGLRAYRDGTELEQLLGQRLRAALFIYVAVERRVTREHLSAVFWPESGTENARHALRQSLYQLRRIVGDGWVVVHAQELRASASLHTDVDDFAAAIQRSDFESAARLYAGPFLDGVHLADNRSWESWVDGRRAHYARGFQKACRSRVDAMKAAGDLAGAVDAARRWATADALDDEAQHRLIEMLSLSGERAEAIRHYENYARTLQAEELHPLDETVELIERVRSGSSAPASLQPASESLPPPLGSAQSEHVPVQTEHVVGQTEHAAGQTEHAALQPVSEVAYARDASVLPPPRLSRWSSGRLAAAAAVVLLLVVAGAWAIASRPAAGTSALSSTAVAVFPFSVRGGEDADFLRDGVASLLGTALDGAASVRPVDARAVFAAISRDGSGAPDIERGSQVAVRLGAGLFILGDVFSVGDQLQIEAVVYAARERSEPLHRAVVSGAAAELFDLVDQLAARLLAGFGDPSADRLLRTAAVTTSSLASFKAYLEGERRMRAGQFESAAEWYLEAIASDSTYAVAHYRLALASEWAPLPGHLRSAQAAARFASRLAPRDRALIEAYESWRTGNARDAERRYRTIVARYPDDVEAWLQLGEILFHFGYLLGRPIADSEEALRQVLFHEPKNVFVVPHLARIAAIEGRVLAIDSLLQPFTPHEVRTDRRLLEARLHRALASGDAGATNELVAEVRRWEDLAVWRLALFVAEFSPDPAAVRPVVSALIEDHRSPRTRAALYWLNSVLHLASGQLTAAHDALARSSAAHALIDDPALRWPFEIVSDMHWATLPLPYTDALLAELRRRITAAPAVTLGSLIGGLDNHPGTGTVIEIEPLRQYALGALALRSRDPVSAGVASATLTRVAASRVATTLVRDLDRGLRARIKSHSSRADEALRLLEALEFGDSQEDVTTIPFVARASERFLRAEVLEALGRDREALAWFSSIGKGSMDELPFAAPAHLRQAQIHERLGERGEAAAHYARFVKLWGDGDAEFQPVVEMARRRMAELTRGRASSAY